MTENKKHVLVLMGGWSAEREVSLTSGEACGEALEQAGYQVTYHDLQPNLSALINLIEAVKPDVVFNALHGRYGEDGNIQGVLNILNVPYTHSGVKASSTAMDKPASLELFKSVGIPVAKGNVIPEAHIVSGDWQSKNEIPRPFVVKPACEGSSVGVYIVGENEAAPDLSEWTFGDALIEEFVDGKELTVAVMDGKALTVTELCPHEGFYSYEAKYTDGKTTHICPAEVDSSLADRMKEHAVQAHNVLGCRGVTRTDFRYNPATDQLIVMEINTQPGMTALSLVPEQANEMGTDFPALVSWMVEAAACDP
ncbi:D-alanine--D-alanine ligase [Curvivirga aplysinae]|uniref:D-alanine--D-alanine ligase n=1 Tax=Curvivirga aplysinae TaxID=2529852 RepID=UPI0012BC009E|nr:D-alanine--D-alanine ligase [Curvivirga aplysinae]MTI10778.1 D-alanine--D-alanine ligase [Curvivirga aplysinae]